MLDENPKCYALRNFTRCKNDAIPEKDLCPEHAEVLGQLTRAPLFPEGSLPEEDSDD